MIRKFYTDRITGRIAYYYLILIIVIYSRIKIRNKITIYIYSLNGKIFNDADIKSH